MKKQLVLLALVPMFAAGLSSCSNDKTQINVFAAASMKETLTTIKAKYEEAHKDVELLINFESSGTLQKQIEAGSACDIFISAAPKQMNALQEKNLINTESRFNMLENKVTLVVPANNPKNVLNFENLKDRLAAHEADFVLAMGNADVPVGQYTQKIFTYYNLDESDLAAAGMLSYGTNVKEVTTQVVQNSVSCGIVYKTDAFSAGLTVKDEATAAMCGQVIYPAALIANAPAGEKAGEFLTYLKTAEASAVFESVGFTALTK
ncbi:MAG: molybdate ABC transporter substrate-binding protein [Bacilli bacterium]|nr:molybdate ABC transporter substrate-binding protein [Bacilli bacterium]